MLSSHGKPDQEYQQEKQWAVFSVNPAHAIVYVDSLIHPIQEEVYLSIYPSANTVAASNPHSANMVTARSRAK